MDLKEQYEKLLCYCYIKTRDRYIAEDIVQEAYLRFWKSYTYQDTGKELAYLYRIAKNLCVDEFRKIKAEDIDNCEEIKAQKCYEPESLIEQVALEKALLKLPETIREIIILRYTNEMSVSDIAKITNMSRFAVHRRMKEGLALLKNALKGDEEND